MIPLATFRKNDDPRGALIGLRWEPRTGVVWMRFRVDGKPVDFPTLYFARRRAEIDAMVADFWGRRNPKTFRKAERRDAPKLGNAQVSTTQGVNRENGENGEFRSRRHG